jgi:hypothetical protein
MSATPPTDWDNESLTANATSSTVVPSESGCDDWRDSDSDQLPDWYETHIAALSARDGLNSVNELTPSLVLWGSSLDGTPLTSLQILTLRIDPSKPLAAQNDTDLDDLADWQEYMVITDYRDPDTDNDGMTDGWEDKHKLDPRCATDATADPDGDGLSNLDEFQHDTNPRSVDSDGDGISDKAETDAGSDPNNKADKPKPNDQEVFDVSIAVGDTSDSASESWTCDVIRHTPSGTKKLYKRVAGAPGPAVPKTFKLKLGYAYELKLKHRGSTKSPADPDYDFSASSTSASIQIADPESLIIKHEENNPNPTTKETIEAKSAFILTKLTRDIQEPIWAKWTKVTEALGKFEEYWPDPEIKNGFLDIVKDIVAKGPVILAWKINNGKPYPAYDIAVAVEAQPEVELALQKLGGKLKDALKGKAMRIRDKINSRLIEQERKIKKMHNKLVEWERQAGRLGQSNSRIQQFNREIAKTTSKLNELEKLMSKITIIANNTDCLVELVTNVGLVLKLNPKMELGLKAVLDRHAEPSMNLSGSSGKFAWKFTVEGSTPSPDKLPNHCDALKDALSALAGAVSAEVGVWFEPSCTIGIATDSKSLRLTAGTVGAGAKFSFKLEKQVDLGMLGKYKFSIGPVSIEPDLKVDLPIQFPYELGAPPVASESYLLKGLFKDMN